MKISKKTLIYEIVIPIAIVIVSVAFAVIFHDYIWGLLTLLLAFFERILYGNWKMV